MYDSSYQTTCSNNVVALAISLPNTGNFCSQLSTSGLSNVCVNSAKISDAGSLVSGYLSVLPNVTITSPVQTHHHHRVQVLLPASLDLKLLNLYLGKCGLFLRSKLEILSRLQL